MKDIRIVRLTEAEGPTESVLLIDGKVQMAVLELPWKSNIHDVSCIPIGDYIATRFKSQKFGETFRLQGVPGREDIEFHWGNTVKDSHGCLIVGMRWGYLNKDRAVLDSGLAFKRFMNSFLYEANIHVKIISVVEYKETKVLNSNIHPDYDA